MMKNTKWLKLITIGGVAIMLLAFIVVPIEYPWYYKVLLFNIGFWSNLLANRELKKLKLQTANTQQI